MKMYCQDQILEAKLASGNLEDTNFQIATKMLLTGVFTVAQFRAGIEEDYGWDIYWIKDTWKHNTELSNGNVECLGAAINAYTMCR